MLSLMNFISTYWKEIAIAVLLFVVSFFWWQDHKGLVNAYDASVESYETRLKELKESHQRETERKAEALEEYKAKLEEFISDNKEIRVYEFMGKDLKVVNSG